MEQATEPSVYDDLWRPVFLHLLVAHGTSSAGSRGGQAACIFHELVHIKVKCTKRTLPTWPASQPESRVGRAGDLVCCLLPDAGLTTTDPPTHHPRGCVCSCRHINRFVAATQNIPKIKCKSSSSTGLTTRQLPCRSFNVYAAEYI